MCTILEENSILSSKSFEFTSILLCQGQSAGKLKWYFPGISHQVSWCESVTAVQGIQDLSLTQTTSEPGAGAPTKVKARLLISGTSTLGKIEQDLEHWRELRKEIGSYGIWYYFLT